MTPRARVIAVVAAISATAAVGTVGATVLSSTGEPEAAATRPAGPRAGAPPLLLDLGVRTDLEATDLRRAAAMQAGGQRAQAARIFARHRSLDARVGGALAAWPHGTLGRLETLARERPGSAFVRLHLGLARYWLRRDRAAVAAWREAVRVEPDSASAVRADDLLHPNVARGLPVFVPGFDAPPAVRRLPAAAQLAALRRRAATGGPDERLLYGVALQRLGKPLSARREFDAAAAAAPRDPEAQVAAAVGRFDKDDPSRAFSRLGPLAQRFPRAPTVRFHLGLLLLWIGQVDEAKRQLTKARALGPRTPLGVEANRFLRRLESVG